MNIYAFLITTLAGLSTMLGSLIILYNGNKKNIISKSLGFASGVMLSVSITDLIPNSLKLILNDNNSINSLVIVFISIFIGIIVSMIIRYKTKEKQASNSKLYNLGIIAMITIILHNIPEGIATYVTSDNNMKLGITLALAIALHNIPEGISISVPIYYSTNSKFKAFKYTFISGLSEVFGAIIAYVFLSSFINNTIIGVLYALIAGIMINISLNELLPESKLLSKKNSYIYFIVGFIFMFLNHLLFN